MYEEIIKSLRLCREILHEDDSCIEFVDGSCEAFPICAYQLMEKAADAIEELQKCINGIEADNDSLCQRIEELSRENKEIMFRANQLEAMNDALRMPQTPHGRLIDADDFDKRIRLAGGMCEEELTEDFKDGIQTVLAMMKTQPTIIPASEDGE